MPISLPPKRQRPRKLPKQARSADTVAAIIEAAARILEERGHAGFSTNGVAERAGVSIGSLYQYFPSKDALIGALINRETTFLLQDAAAALEQSSCKAGLAVLIDACIAHQFRRPALARLLDFEEARMPLDPDIVGIKEQFAAILFEVLRQRGISAQSDMTIAVRDVAAIIRGMVDATGEIADGQAGLRERVQRAVYGYLGCYALDSV